MIGRIIVIIIIITAVVTYIKVRAYRNDNNNNNIIIVGYNRRVVLPHVGISYRIVFGPGRRLNLPIVGGGGGHRIDR